MSQDSRPEPQPTVVAPSSRLYSVNHTTVYRYSAPVRRSTHLFRLRPVHDRMQEVLEHEIHVSASGRRTEYEDVFGNEIVHLEVSDPYCDLRIEARSVVRVHSSHPPPAGEEESRHSSIPIVWMPWQSQMMLPYLLPPELEVLDDQAIHSIG